MIGSMGGDWEELWVDFCHLFSLTERINALLIDILDFEQLEKESIGVAWARFLYLFASSPDISIPNDASLDIFCLGLDITVGGSFATQLQRKEEKSWIVFFRKPYLSYRPKQIPPGGIRVKPWESLITWIWAFIIHISIFICWALSRTTNTEGKRNSTFGVLFPIRGWTFREHKKYLESS